MRNNTGNFQLTSVDDGVAFDITGDGVLKQMAWTEPDSDIAFLAIDRNDNGLIDNGSELFGDATWLSNGQKARNGFEVLKDLDGPPLLRDGQIDQNDEVFSRLRLWLDRNHNGVSETNELISLEAAGLVTIFTDYRESRRVDRHGNAYRYVGKAMARERNGQLTPRRVFDVFFKVAP